MLVLVSICKNNGFWGKRGGNCYDWKEAFDSYGEEWEQEKWRKPWIISICQYLRGLESDKKYKTKGISRCERE